MSNMKQIESRFDDEIMIAIYPQNIIERLKLFFCNRIIVSITTTPNTEYVESEQKLRTI